MSAGLLFAAISGAIALGLFFLATGPWTIVTASLFILYLFCLCEIAISITSRRRSTASLMFWFFWGLMVILPGAVQTSNNQYYFDHGLHYDEDLQLLTVFYLFLFLSVFAGAYHLLYALPSRSAGTRIRVNPTAAILVAGTLAVLSITIIVGWSFNYIFGRIDPEFIEFFDPLTYNLQIVVPRCALTASIYLNVVFLKNIPRSNGTPLILLLGLVLLGVQAFVYAFDANPIHVTRYITLSFVTTLTLIIVGRLSSDLKAYIFSIMFLFLFTLFPALRVIRAGKDAELFTSPQTILMHGDLDGFQSMMNIVALVQERGQMWGAQIISAIFFFVPRSIWAGKSVGTGELGAHFARYDNFNVSSPFPIELYADFGILGLFLAGVVVALICIYLDRAMVESDKSSRKFIVSAVVTGFIMIVLRGSLVGVIAPVVCTAGMVWIGGWFAISNLGRNKRQYIKGPNRGDQRRAVSN